MAKHVRIASVAGAPLRVSDITNYEACVQEELAYWEAQLAQVLPDKPDLIVTPECCDRPYGLPSEDRPAYYRVRGDRLQAFFMEAARKNRANIAYSAVREMPDGTFRNSIQFINRQGGLDGIYNKNLLVIEENTVGNILYGREIKAIQTDIGRVCGAICFDLNFDEPLRKTAAQKPDLLIFGSAYHGGIMQRHWAYMCRTYFVSCINGTQSASIINPVGEVVAESSNYYDYVSATVNLDYAVVHLDHNWEKLAAAKRKYGTEVEYCTPFGLGSVLLTSESGERTARDVVAEFDLELWDDYYQRSMDARYVPGRMEPEES